MFKYFCLGIFLFLICCCEPVQKKEVDTGISVSPFGKHDANIKHIPYADEQLEAFLDSIGQLPSQPLAEQATLFPDSIFQQQALSSRIFSERDFALVKRAARQKRMTLAAARRVFKDPTIGRECNKEGLFRKFSADSISVAFYPFTKKTFEEYAIGIGFQEHCHQAALYFFKQNKLIAIHNGYSHYGLEVKYFKDADNKTVVYYNREFKSGSGIWWNNFFFYKYDGDQLLPVLNELKDGNSQLFWGFRAWQLLSTVQSTNPLAIKMIYYIQLPDTARADSGPLLVNDSTTLTYKWNDRVKKFEGGYQNSKLTRSQILSYNVQANDILFINAYYTALKESLRNQVNRRATLNYLRVVKNSYQIH